MASSLIYMSSGEIIEVPFRAIDVASDVFTSLVSNRLLALVDEPVIYINPFQIIKVTECN